MTLPKVWHPREEAKAEEMPEWRVRWGPVVTFATHVGMQFASPPIPAPHAWDAWKQVKGAPAFGSCRIVRVKGEEK